MKNIMMALVVLAGGFWGGNAMALDPQEDTVNQEFKVSGNWSELKRGWGTLVLHVTDARENNLEGATVIVAYDMAMMPMNPPQRPVIDKGSGLYEKEVFLGMKGEWVFDVTIDDGSVADVLQRSQVITK